MGKLWLFNDSLLHVAAAKGKIFLKHRCIVSSEMYQFDVKNVQLKYQQKSMEIMPTLQELQSGKKEVVSQIEKNKEEEPSI